MEENFYNGNMAFVIEFVNLKDKNYNLQEREMPNWIRHFMEGKFDALDPR